MNNLVITAVLTLSVIFIVLVSIVHTLNKRYKEVKQKVQRLELDNKSLQKNLIYLLNHGEEIEKIKTEAEKLSDEIKGAKTDEEISDIVSVIISNNNNRVQNNSKN